MPRLVNVINVVCVVLVLTVMIKAAAGFMSDVRSERISSFTGSQHELVLAR